MGVIRDDLHVDGRLSANQIAYPNNSVGSDSFDGTQPLVATKQEHQYLRMYQDDYNTAAFDNRRLVHYAYGDGDLVSVIIGVSQAAIGAATVSVDVLKNGVTALSAPVLVNSTTTANIAYDEVAAGIAGDGTYTADAVFEVSLDATAGGGTLPKGLYVILVFREKPGA